MNLPLRERRQNDRPSALARIRRLWSRVASHWQPMDHPHREEFLVEQYRANRAAVRAAMMVGAVVFGLRGFGDYANGIGSPVVWQEIAVRGTGTLILLVLIAMFGKFTPADRGQRIMAAFVFVLITGLAGVTALNGDRTPYSLFPITFVCLMSTALWLRGKQLMWTLVAALAPVLALMASGTMAKMDIESYGFYIPLSIVLGLLIRHGRLTTAFDAFLLRKHLAAQAHSDPLTGILNRAGGQDQLAAQMVGGNPIRPSSLLYFDLDRFKSINDTYGHPVGDKLIQRTAERVKHLLRSKDIMARFGGEEFVVFLPGVGMVDATLVAERIRSEIERHADPVPATVSIGVSEFRPGETIDQAVERADQALLIAKQTGRNRVMVLD